MKSSKVLKYDVLCYSGSFPHLEFVHLISGLANLHECITRCSTALAIIVSLKEDGYLKILRNGVHIGNYFYDKPNNIFVFNSIENPFNKLYHYERKK